MPPSTVRILWSGVQVVVLDLRCWWFGWRLDRARAAERRHVHGLERVVEDSDNEIRALRAWRRARGIR